MRISSRITLPKKAVVLVAGVASAVAAGIAIAAWNVTGSGDGYAKAGSATSLTIGDASAAVSADLYPGTTGSAKVRVTNPNGFAVRVTSVSGAGTITSDKGAACDAATGVTFTNQTGLSADVAAGATVTLDLANAVAMSSASDNSCQGALFTIPVTVTGTTP